MITALIVMFSFAVSNFGYAAYSYFRMSRVESNSLEASLWWDSLVDRLGVTVAWLTLSTVALVFYLAILRGV